MANTSRGATHRGAAGRTSHQSQLMLLTINSEHIAAMAPGERRTFGDNIAKKGSKKWPTTTSPAASPHPPVVRGKYQAASIRAASTIPGSDCTGRQSALMRGMGVQLV
jgi:hypothetical protein